MCRVKASMHTHIHTYTRACTHMHRDMYTHVLTPLSCGGGSMTQVEKYCQHVEIAFGGDKRERSVELATLR